MPTWRSFEAFGRELKSLQLELERNEATKIINKIGKRAQELAQQAAAADLGYPDGSFSGWPNHPLDTQLKHLKPGRILLQPTRKSAGPWTVAERGRGHTNTAGFSGPGVNRRTGLTNRNKKTGNLRKISAFTGGSKWSGYTDGKSTASDAVNKIDNEMQRIAAVELLRVTKQHFDVG